MGIRRQVPYVEREVWMSKQRWALKSWFCKKISVERGTIDVLGLLRVKAPLRWKQGWWTELP